LPYIGLAEWTALPYGYSVQSVIQTSVFLAQAKRCGLSDDELQEIVAVMLLILRAGR
jgi:alkylhydroperoxidase/carboxymuconolactone decarboxylase family protein YurZ